MAYKQLINPNLDTLGSIGWCLAFVEKAYNSISYSYGTATIGWNACEFIHQNRDLPADVAVPVWYSYYEYGPTSKTTINYGHVAINVPGRGVLSSPYKADNTQQWFKDIDECAEVLRCSYLGWSEDLMGVRVVEEVNMSTIATRDMVESLAHAYLNDSLGANPDLQFYIGQPVEDVINSFNSAPERDAYLKYIDNLRTTIAQLDEALTAKAIPIPPPAPPKLAIVSPTPPPVLKVAKPSLVERFLKALFGS